MGEASGAWCGRSTVQGIWLCFGGGRVKAAMATATREERKKLWPRPARPSTRHGAPSWAPTRRPSKSRPPLLHARESSLLRRPHDKQPATAMKIKLKNPQPGGAVEAPTNGASHGSSSTTSAATSAPKLALKLKTSAPSASGDSAEQLGSSGDVPKQKRKYTKKPKTDESGQALPSTKTAPKPKKRPLEDGEDGTPAKRKHKPTMKSLSAASAQESDDDERAPAATPMTMSRPPMMRTSSIKISLKSKSSSTGVVNIKVKPPKGKPPFRPPGVGYDSEAEEAEDDPAIESQFVLRMQPGPDCELLRRAIEDKTIGKTQAYGGPGVSFRFFDREGRKAMVNIQNRLYAATMVELPCVIESLKSWNKKDWVKSADVCQMLLVLGRVNSEEEAKKFTRPREIEPDSHRYPHGLTPPMQWVRKRRFRPRKSYLDVERIETHTEDLLTADDAAEDTKYELVDSDRESSSEEEDDGDAPGEGEEMADGGFYAETPTQEEEVDVDDLAQMFHEEFADDDGQVQMEGVDDLFGGENEIEVETPAGTGAHEVAMHALAQHGNIVVEPESAASTPAGATSPDDDDDDDGDDDDEIDPEQAEKQRFEEQTRAEIRELEQTIAEQKAKQESTPNIPYKRKLQGLIDQLTKDKHVKMSKIGMTED